MTNEATRRRVNMQDYDDACAILTWCGGTALGEEDGELYVMSVPGPQDPQFVKDGDLIEQSPDGGFRVVSAPGEEASQ